MNLNVPAFTFGGRTYTMVGVDSNGYAILGGGNGPADISFIPQDLPNPARPNNVLAPYWTNLDGRSAPGLRAGTLTNGTNTWLVLQWNVHPFGDMTPRNMQVWIGIDGKDDVSYRYAADTVNVDAPAGTGLTVGAESPTGQFGAQITGPPAGNYVVTATPGAAGESKTWTVTAKGIQKGNQPVTTSLDSNLNVGTTIVSTPIKVVKK